NDGQVYTVDAAAPAAPSTPDLETASDTGASDSDDITNDDTPTFSGTAEADSTVRLYADGVEVGSAVATGGTWSITASTLADDTYDITARATDAAGNESPASAALSVTIDTTAPAASIALDAITADNVVNAAEAGGNVAVTGTVGGDVTDGDTVTVTVNSTQYQGLVSSGAFSINVAGS
ncbi:MAG: Ig-like domain-containing protein, partial [Hyphomicrobiales bacterium]|nr:Ig-like domain-containing protein [Hyphomicrobiales bacterium]